MLQTTHYYRSSVLIRTNVSKSTQQNATIYSILHQLFAKYERLCNAYIVIPDIYVPTMSQVADAFHPLAVQVIVLAPFNVYPVLHEIVAEAPRRLPSLKSA